MLLGIRGLRCAQVRILPEPLVLMLDIFNGMEIDMKRFALAIGLLISVCGGAHAQDCSSGVCQLPVAAARVVTATVAPVVGVVHAVAEAQPVRRVASVAVRSVGPSQRLVRRARVRCGR
jgi:multidrug efflux pump subunit AcrA (membrane-fusion protein)